MKFIKKYGAPISLGALSGFVNGLLGAGGGVIATYYLASKMAKKEKKGENSGTDIFANAVATMLPISAVSLAIYLAGGYRDVGVPLAATAVCAAAGGALGSYLLTRIGTKVLKIAFSLLVAISGVMMIFR